MTTPIFHEELDRVRLKLKEEQEQKLAAEREKDRLAGDLAVARGRLGQAETQLELVGKERDGAVQKQKELASKLADHQVTVQRLGEAESELTKTLTMLDQANIAVAKLWEEKAQLASDLDGVQQVLARREEEFERATKLLAAFEQRARADAVISGA